MAYADKKKMIEYNRSFNEKAYDRLAINVKKGQKAKLQEIAKEAGCSLNDFVNQAITEKLERMGKEI